MAWSRLQSASVFKNGANPTVAYTSNLTAGTKLICAILNYTSGAHANTITDGNSNNFTKVADTGISSGSFGGVQLWVLDTPAGDVGTTPTVTVTTSGNGPYAMVIQEVSGLKTGTTGSLDGTAGTLTGTQGSEPVTTGSPSYSSTAANEYLVSVVSDTTNGASFPTITPAALTADPNNQSFTNASTCTGIAYGNSTNGAESCGWTVSGGNGSFDGWGVILVAFQLASGNVSLTAPGVTLAAPLLTPAIGPNPFPAPGVSLVAPVPALTFGAASIPLPVAQMALAAPLLAPPAFGGDDDPPWHIRRRR